MSVKVTSNDTTDQNTMQKMIDYLQLTKPTIMLLVIFTGSAAMILEGSMLSRPLDLVLVLFALYLAGGSANAFNQCFERKIDSLMTRTSKRRPLPQGKISLVGAFTFSIIIGILGVALFYFVFNLLSALLALGTILFYSLFYTLYLKPNTDQNIVIGGVAGAMAPVIAWAAVAGEITVTPLLLFSIVFFWTPAHFWALALFCKDDYVRAKLPMLPVVRGEQATYKWIIFYSAASVVTSLSLLLVGAGIIYALSAATLGAILIQKSFAIMRIRTASAQRGFFGYSIVYLLALLVAI
ncbi:MAG: protoheme IX farnesyltransferase, partial [candidate division Zixibacteria bacterium]|nr:protoheme IX farnesyltransferase [candidate division Zixibacteria bacterium]